VRWLSDAVLAHLGNVADAPELNGTRYELIEKIGQGGMGSVYLARDRELDRPVALKILSALVQDPETQDRLAKEARIIARLEHPGIVPIHDAGLLPDGRFYYAMKWVRGKRLDEQVRGPTTLAERLSLFQKICDTVAFAHAHGVVHRDLKPQNIMLGPFGEVLVMDWGVARDVTAPRELDAPRAGNGMPVKPAQTAHGTVVGTPGYMAPEQARGDVEQIDERSDVYALGGILYFLLTGRAPVPEAVAASLPPAAFPSITPPRRYDRTIPRTLEAICLKALAAECAQRYPGVPELSADIRRFLAGERVEAYPEGPFQSAGRLGAKYRAPLALILAYLIMRVLLLIFARS
jgi:serine/threonine protein kinase